MKLRAGDTVVVIAGKDRGKTGRIIRVLPGKNRVVVGGINMRTRHIKKTAQQAGQKIRYEAALSLSNVMLLDPKLKKPSRVGFRVDPKTGKKVRISKLSGEVIEQSKAPVEKKAAASKQPAPAKEGKQADAPTLPKKQPFWKRAFSGESAAEGETADAPGKTNEHPTQTVVRRSRESS